jgi:hypothetical protein
LPSYPQGDLESPFLKEELFVGDTEVVWEAHVAALETETPFAQDLMQRSEPAVQSEYEEKEETSREVEAPYAYEEELEEHEDEDVEKFERDVKDTPAALETAREDEEPEGTEEEFEAFEDEGPEEALAIPYEPESSIVLSHENAVQQALEEPLPQLFDAERPEPEEDVDEEAELPTDPADGWVVPEDVRRAGEAQTIAYDDAPPWEESGRNCAGRLSEGARVLRGYLLDNFPGIREIGGYNCRQNSASPNKLSVHGTGRALDIMLPTIGGRANSTIGDPIANWLVVNASAIGVQYLIWNRVRWSGGRRREKFARYTGPNPHRDHIHVELTLDGAQRSTPWFAGRAMLAEVAPVEAIDYDKAIRLNRVYGRQLGWQDHLRGITRLFGLANDAPEERDFAEAVARWQRQQGLGVDGILGSRTWERVRSTLPVAPVATSPSVTGLPGTSPAEPMANWAQIDPNQRMRYVMGLLVKNYQYPENGAAGIVGNLWAESGVLPNRVEGSTPSAPMRAPDFTGKMTEFTAEQVMNRNRAAKQGPRRPGIGLAQWSSPPRRAGLFNHTFQGRKLGANILYNMDAQVDYLVTELQTQYRHVNNILRKTNVSLEEASDEVVYNYEVPGSILGQPDPDGRRRKLPRNHPAVKNKFEERRSFSRNALRAHQPSIPS